MVSTQTAMQIDLIDFSPDHLDNQLLLERLQIKFTNQTQGALLYLNKKQFIIRNSLRKIPLVYCRDRDLFIQLLEGRCAIDDVEQWATVWKQDYEIIKKMAILSGYSFPRLLSKLKENVRESWYRDLCEDFDFWKEFVRESYYNSENVSLASAKILQNIEQVKTLITIEPQCFYHLNDKLKKNPEVITAACEQSVAFFKYSPINLLNKDVTLKALEKKAYTELKLIPEKLWDKDIALSIAKNKPYLVDEIPSRLRTREVLKLAMDQDGFGYLLSNVKDRKLKNDEELILICLRRGGRLNSLNMSIISKKIALLAVNNDHLEYPHLPANLKQDLDICMATLNKSGCILYEMPNAIKLNREIALKAVKKTGSALYYIPKQFYTDREIVFTAFCHSDAIPNFDYDPTFNYFPDITQRWHHVDIERKNFPPLWELIPKKLYTNDRELVLQMVRNFPKFLVNVSHQIMNDRTFWSECLSINGNCFEFIPSEFRNDLELCCTVLKNYRDSIIHFPVEIQSDPRIFKVLMEYSNTNEEKRLEFAKELKDYVIEFQFESRSTDKAATVIGINICDIPIADISNNIKLNWWRRQELEQYYFDCHIPIKQ